MLLRFLTGEPAEFAGRAVRLLEKAQRGEILLRVHPMVVAETVRVLRCFYGYSKEISGALIPLLEQPALWVEGARTGVRALGAMAEDNADFADALLAETARSRGEGVASFDGDFRQARRRAARAGLTPQSAKRRVRRRCTPSSSSVT